MPKKITKKKTWIGTFVFEDKRKPKLIPNKKTWLELLIYKLSKKIELVLANLK